MLVVPVETSAILFLILLLLLITWSYKAKEIQRGFFFLQQKTFSIYGITNFLLSIQELGLLFSLVNGYTIPNGFVFIISHKKKFI